MIEPIRYLSLFSGIEAASVAWAPLGWVCVGVAEIEGFPKSALAHHYPDVPNLGDVTKITEADIAALGRIDVMVFGSPCQDMSIAGKRKGLLNADGTVTRSGLFFTAFNIFQWARKRCGARFALWENVPGSYSSNEGRDFASVVEFMAGLDDVAVPANGWGTEGCALGDNGLLEWSCLDAQWFGVAQRRRRVFAVLDTGNWAGRQPILLECESLRGDSAPSRKTGQDVTGSLTASSGRRGGVDDPERGTMVPVAFGGNNQSGAIDVATARNACGSGSGRLDFETETFLVQPALSVALRGRDGGATAELDGEVAGTQRASTGSGDKAHVLAPIAFSSKDYGGDAMVDLSPTLRAGNHDKSHANAGSPPAIAFNARQDSDSWLDRTGPLDTDGGTQAVCITGDITHTLKAEGFDASEDGTGRGQPIVAAYGISSQPTPKFAYELSPPLDAKTSGGGRMEAVASGMAVRRLTPMECERLQGAPDGYTRIPVKKYSRKMVTKLRPESMWERIDGDWWLMAADGPRYKSLGNSMAVPVMAYIGKQIAAAVNGAPA